MPLPIFAALGQTLLGLLLSLMAIFIILLVLVQRGRGGGLAGALGGMGGSSAFGAKAGDVFTRITIVAAAIWIVLCIAAAKWGASSGDSQLNVRGPAPAGSSAAVSPAEDAEDEKGAPADIEAAGKSAAAGGPSESTPAEGAAPSTGAAAPPADPASPAATK
jgi:preprotein translocase subunit SecG